MGAVVSRGDVGLLGAVVVGPAPVVVTPTPVGGVPPAIPVKVVGSGKRPSEALSFEVVLTMDANPMTVIVVRPDNSIRPGSSNMPEDGARVLGVTPHGGLAGESVLVQVGGSLPVTTPVAKTDSLYMGPDGSLTSNPSSGIVQINVAYAYTTTNVRVRIGTPLYHE